MDTCNTSRNLATSKVFCPRVYFFPSLCPHSLTLSSLPHSALTFSHLLLRCSMLQKTPSLHLRSSALRMLSLLSGSAKRRLIFHEMLRSLPSVCPHSLPSSFCTHFRSREVEKQDWHSARLRLPTPLMYCHLPLLCSFGPRTFLILSSF